MISCPSCRASNDDAARFCSACGTALAQVCPSCGAAAPARARFCSECGSPLGADGDAGPLEERRWLSILFADLAGFTQRSDQADPEDVRGILVPFHALAKDEIERFGGTLDKFIGDAAMGVFGAPVAHEDDAERAVRAALSICERVTARGMPVRIAVNTGEALVTFGEGPQVGERVAGDVVNTASRLQGHAPEGEVVVGETTHRATRGVIAYRELPAVTVKGKAEPLAMWLATSIQPTVPERDEDDPPPFVGRDRERRQLHDLLDHAVESRRPHMATVVGEPGIGKTRLVSDLGEHVRAEGKDILFHRGRCLPYGESITFTALEEIVRALIGVGPGQDRRSVAEALERTLEELEPRPTERGWLSSRLAPLVGTSNPGDAPADRSESFAAWTRFLELVADTAPLAMVVEDLHWADPAMLEFLDHLVTEAREVPMFVLCTSRPELFAQHPSWGSGSAEVTTISLAPLSDEDMQVLLGALLLHSILPAEAREPLMRRAGGNPLYAREFVHMLEDRGEDGRAERDPDASGSGVRVPDTVQALIAARLDSLEPAERSLLQSASVVGDRFWPGVLAALDHPDDLDGSLRELQRRGMIRRSPLSTIPEQTEFAFTHGLIRDVAYGRLPRAARARMHLAVTVWLEGTAGERLSERADLLASHATRALDLARAASLTEELPALQDAALRFLVMAGSRQKTLDTARAADYFARAAELAPAHGTERADLVRQATSTAWRAGRLTSDEAVAAYRESVAIALAAGDRETAARAMRRLYYQLGLQGETAAARTTLDQAIELLETADEPGLTLAELYACRSESEMFAGRSQESLDWAERALQLPRTEAVTLMGLHLRGNARCELGDLDGIADLHHALDVARGSGNALDLVTSYSYLCEWVGLLEGPTAALAMNREAIDLCSRRGLSGQESWARAEGMWLLFDLGEWDEIVATTDPLQRWADEHGDVQVGTVARSFRARVLAHRGLTDEAAEALTEALPAARQIEDLQVLGPVLLAAAITAGVDGDQAEAIARLQEFDAITEGGPTEYRELQLPEAVRVAIGAGQVDLAERLVGDRPVHAPRTQMSVDMSRALVSEARGAFDDALIAFRTSAAAWDRWNVPLEQGHALMGAARCLRALDRSEEAEAVEADGKLVLEALGVPEVTAPRM